MGGAGGALGSLWGAGGTGILWGHPSPSPPRYSLTDRGRLLAQQLAESAEAPPLPVHPTLSDPTHTTVPADSPAPSGDQAPVSSAHPEDSAPSLDSAPSPE